MILSLLKDVDYLYEPIRHVYKSKDYTMVHISEGRYKLLKEEFGVSNKNTLTVVFDSISHEAFFEEIRSRHLDMQQLESHLLKAILDNGVYAKLTLDKVYKYVSEEDVEQHLAAWREFSKNLIDHINKL